MTATKYPNPQLLFDQMPGEEIASLREQHSKVFDLGCGIHPAVIYPEPVHFRDPKTGKWQDIDNTLEETVTAIGRRMLRNHAGRVRMEFPVQYINSAGKTGDVFVVGGWSSALSVASGSGNFEPKMVIRFEKSGAFLDCQFRKFSTARVGWQFGCWAVSAPGDYDRVLIGVCYERNAQTGMFSNLFVHREEFGQSFAYDANKNLVGVANLSTKKSDIQYDDADNVKSYRQPGAADAAKYTMSCGSTTVEHKKHLLKESVSPMGQRDVFTHDSYGNTLTSVRQKSGDAAFIKTESTYTANGNYNATSKDARGNVVTQNVNATDGTLTSVTDPNGQTVSYTYDASKRVTGVQTTAGGKTYKNAYAYANDRIQKVQHNTTTDTPDVEYTFGYDALGRKTAVKVGSQTLSTNVYNGDRSGLLSEVQYGNGGKVKYAYDAYDRLTGVKHDGETSDRYTYEYGADGEASVVRDHNLGRVLQTERDLAQRAMGTQLRDASGNLLYRTELDYDTQNRLVGFGETASGRNYKTAYTYDNDNRVTGMTFDGGNAIGYTYDSLGRIATRTAGPLSTTYGYVGGGYGTGSTTPLVASIQQTGIPFSYAYDSRGNIISETRNGKTTSYAYDALGQLIRVNDPHLNQTWVYNYDRGGNILSKVRYAYTTGALGTVLETIPYAYGDANWKDKLTAYNGKAITCDAIGNPLTDGTWTYQWQAGRQLKQMTKSGTTIQFKYDHNGLRVGKVVNGTETKYMLHGKLVTHLTVGSDNLHFFYDAQGRPAKVSYNGVIYTYIHNLQGDIVGLLDNSGALVVEYKYDAWGKPIATTGSLAATLGKRNPFRYRGYVYDEETELYYLRSRYYKPLVGRFMNADVLVCQNVFCYASGSPLNLGDSSGMSSEAIASPSSTPISFMRAVAAATQFGERASIEDGEIAIFLEGNEEDLLLAYDTLGIEVTSVIMALSVDRRYINEVGKEYMFTRKCMAYEIREHIHAYLYATGKRDLEPNLIASAYMQSQQGTDTSEEAARNARNAVISATKEINLREADLANREQRFCFRYAQSIRRSRLADARKYYKGAKAVSWWCIF